MADDPKDPGDKEDPALTAKLSTLAEALPELLDRFRQLARTMGAPGPTAQLADEQPAQSLELAAAMDVAVEAARGELGKRARLVKLYAPAPPVLATERQLGLMLLGLLVHAAQALPLGRVDEHRLDIGVGTGDDGWARVSVEAHGPGIAGRAGSARLELPPAVAPHTDLRA